MSPFAPEPTSLLKLLGREKVTHLGFKTISADSSEWRPNTQESLALLSVAFTLYIFPAHVFQDLPNSSAVGKSTRNIQPNIGITPYTLIPVTGCVRRCRMWRAHDLSSELFPVPLLDFFRIRASLIIHSLSGKIPEERDSEKYLSPYRLRDFGVAFAECLSILKEVIDIVIELLWRHLYRRLNDMIVQSLEIFKESRGQVGDIYGFLIPLVYYRFVSITL